jgi:4-amino-4-deoxy-L-arabinose transferase-like glycosyltransferase
MRRHSRGDSPHRGPLAAPTDAPVHHPRGWHFVLVCGVALLLCAVLKLPALLYPPTETDEQIYWQLAENLGRRGEYTLRGSPLLTSLSSHIYDRPVFHHPPLFAAALVPFVLADNPRAAVVVSWAGHFLVIIAVALIGRQLVLVQGTTDYLAARFWMPVLGVTTDPLLAFISRRLWIDSLLAGLVAMACAALVLAAGPRRMRWLLVSGVLLGLAGLAKLTALMLLPVLVLFAAREMHDWRSRFRAAAAIVGPVVLLVVPWLAIFYQHTGVLVPSWVKPDAQLMEIYPFLRTAVDRPWYYYVTTLAFIAPVTVIAVWAGVRHREMWPQRTFRFAVSWLIVFVTAQTVLGAGGYGFQMRHVAPAVAAIYVLLLAALFQRERPVLLFLSGAAILAGTVTGAMHLLVPELDELLTLQTIGGLTLF